MELPNTIEETDKALKKNINIVKKGRPTYTALELQVARDTIKKLNEHKAALDYESRKPFIKVVDVNRPTGNSSVNAHRGKRFAVNPSSTSVGI